MIQARLSSSLDRLQGIQSLTYVSLDLPDVNNQLRVLEDLTDRLGSFQENVNQSQNSLASIEEKLASHDALGVKDPRNLEKLQVSEVAYS